jgi:hypothetical protein
VVTIRRLVSPPTLALPTQTAEYPDNMSTRIYRRLRFDGVTVQREAENRCRVEIAFTFAGQPIHVSATGEAEGPGPLKAAAAATLVAVEKAVARRFTSEIADLDHISALGKRLIAVLVDIDFEGNRVQVFGSCQLATSEIEAAIKATLNATNRFVELAMRQ